MPDPGDTERGTPKSIQRLTHGLSKVWAECSAKQAEASDLLGPLLDMCQQVSMCGEHSVLGPTAPLRHGVLRDLVFFQKLIWHRSEQITEHLPTALAHTAADYSNQIYVNTPEFTVHNCTVPNTEQVRLYA